MDARLRQDKIKTALKQMLKKRNHTYADLAKVWACSLPTVKRQLGPEELPLSRLLMALEWLNLTLADLHKLSEASDLGSPRFTNRQNEFLAKNPREFSFFMKLYEGLSPKQIADRFKIPALVLDKILIQLEKYDLIKIGSGGKVKPAYDRMPGVDGPLAEAHMKRIIDRMAQFQKNRISDVLSQKARGQEVTKGGLTWNSCSLSEKSYNEYLKRAHDLMDELAETSKFEDEEKIAVVGFGFFMCEKDDPNLRLVTDIVDEGLEGL